MNIGEKLFELRKEKNLSQEVIADKLSVTRQTVSKWETNQSTPDFDKIIPLCELFEITADELLTGKKIDDNNNDDKKYNGGKLYSKQEVKIKSAKIVSISILIYILSIAFLVLAIPVFKMNIFIAIAIFLCIIGITTSKIVKHYMLIPKFEKTLEEQKEEKIIKQIENIIISGCFVLYFLISFLTKVWHITWLIFVISMIICRIIRLFFMLNSKEEKVNAK